MKKNSQKKNLKVLTIVNSLEMGGIEKTLLSCIERMDRKQVEMNICCFKEGGVLEKDFKKTGVQIFYIKKTGLIILDFIQLLFLLWKNPHQIVHSRFGFTSGGFVLASKMVGIKSYVSIHNTSPSSFARLKKIPVVSGVLTIQLWIHRIITKKFADRIIGHSKANLDANYPAWCSSDKFSLLYNGVNFQSINSDEYQSDSLLQFLKPNHIVILHIGSFRNQKNHFFLVDVFAKLKTPNKQLILVGDGSLLPKVKAKVKELKLDGQVLFAGKDVHLKQYFEASNLFFFPSIQEGLGNVLIEAQFFNKPICASDIMPHYESVYPDYRKYFFKPTATEEAIISLENLIDDLKSKEIEDATVHAKDFVEKNFSIQAMSEHLCSLYRNEIKSNNN